MGTPMRTRVRNRTRVTFKISKDLGPDIEEGEVNRRPLQALSLLTWGDARSATVLCAISSQPMDYARGLVYS